MIRRLAALLLATAVFHLSVARADAACAMPQHDAPAADHEGMDHGAGPTTEETSCETPLSECCQALVSCAPTLSFSEARLVTDLPTVHMTVVSAVIERPLSRSTAPEPPPPKA